MGRQRGITTISALRSVAQHTVRRAERPAIRTPEVPSMWHAIFVIQIPVLEKIVRTVLVYATIVVLFRLAGKRGLATLNTLDFVVVFLLSNVVQNAIIGNDNSFSGGAIGAATLVGINAAVNRLVARSEVASRWFEGSPTTVIADGTPLSREIRRLGLRRGDLEQAVRLQNGEAIDEVASGVLEPSGHLIVTLKPSERSATKGDIDHVLSRLASLERQTAGGERASHPS
ncbi:MAG: DUF421 domain-containing protein [Solirubrobacterales bacterium]|nr:DUF421 domain-containing protein [Solirubrobacterales bacterium]